MTVEGAQQIKHLDPYKRQETETIAWSEGIETEVSSEGTMNVWSINNGDWIKVKGVDFGSGAKEFTARVASARTGGNIVLRLSSIAGTVIGSCTVPGTGGWQAYTAVTCYIASAEGVQDLCFVFTGEGTTDLFNFDWWQLF